MSTLLALLPLPTAPEPPRNHGNPGEVDDTKNFDDEDGCKSHENDEGEVQNGEVDDANAAGQNVDAAGQNVDGVINDANAAGQNFGRRRARQEPRPPRPQQVRRRRPPQDMTVATREATEELVPKAPRRVQRGRKASARTEGLREQRMKLMSANKNRNHPEVVAINDDVDESCRRDCRDWVDGVATEMQTASDENDSKTVCQLAGLLSEKRTASKRPTVDEFGKDVDTEDEEEQFWLRFVPDKFKAVDSERNREPPPQSPPRTNVDDTPKTTKEKDEALGKMGANKASGPDDVPAEVHENSVVAKEMLHETADDVWTTEGWPEVVPDKLAVGDFCMLHEGKGKDPDDRKSHRAAGPLPLRTCARSRHGQLAEVPAREQEVVFGRSKLACLLWRWKRMK